MTKASVIAGLPIGRLVSAIDFFAAGLLPLPCFPTPIALLSLEIPIVGKACSTVVRIIVTDAA
ncbi:hypothetical protein RMR21_023235 (plasmid) [Agrobacterium sp. rho-8.1]|nr:hypothetical protein [Agrobacterium sp. rho-8.1]